MPKIKKNQKLYIAIFSIGAYQEIISGIGGLHHCLIPEGNELIITKNKNGSLKYIPLKNQTTNHKVFDLLDYVDDKYMNTFYKK